MKIVAKTPLYNGGEFMCLMQWELAPDIMLKD